MRLFFLLPIILCLSCGYSDEKQTPAPTPSGPVDPGKPLSGQALFASKCASCHGGATPNIGGEDEADIKRALASVGAMKRVVISDPEIKAVAEFLATALTADKESGEYDDNDDSDEDEGESEDGDD